MAIPTTKKANNCYRKGEKAYAGDATALEEAIACFQKAIECDANFARAWSYLGYCKVSLAMARKPGCYNKQLLKEALEDTRRGVELDDDDHTTHWDLAWSLLHLGEFGQARKAIGDAFDRYESRTHRLDQKPGVLAELGEAFIYLGEPDTAIDIVERAFRIPDWYRWVLAMAYYSAREYQKSLDCLSQMFRDMGDPRYNVSVELLKAASHARLAERAARDASVADTHMRQAKAHMRNFIKKNPRWTSTDEGKRMPFKNVRDRDHWVKALEMAGLPRTRRKMTAAKKKVSKKR
jgi:tetratricopeptide (TPR) repeat protein